MLEMLNKGGPVMFVLFALSIYVTAVIIYKAYQFWSLRVSDCDFAQDVVQSLKRSDFENAAILLNNQPNPMVRVIEATLQCIKDSSIKPQGKEDEIAMVGTAELRKLEAHVKGLEMAANISPLLGLLGTVTGMVKAFSVLQEAGTQIDPALLAGGIWEALLTTVAGLAIAIPALAAHYIIDGKIERFRHNMEETTTRIMNLDFSQTTPKSAVSHAF